MYLPADVKHHRTAKPSQRKQRHVSALASPSQVVDIPQLVEEVSDRVDDFMHRVENDIVETEPKFVRRGRRPWCTWAFESRPAGRESTRGTGGVAKSTGAKECWCSLVISG